MCLDPVDMVALSSQTGNKEHICVSSDGRPEVREDTEAFLDSVAFSNLVFVLSSF